MKIDSIIPSALAVEVEASTPPAAPAPSLQIGQELTAKVLQQLPDGRLLIDLQGARVAATAPQGLPAGADLRVRVAQLQPQVLLQILPGASAPAAAVTQLLLSNLPGRADVAQALHALQAALPQDPAGPSGSPSPSLVKLQALLQDLLPAQSPLNAEQVAAFVRDGGLQYEAKLAQAAHDHPSELTRVAERDLKGAVLRALTELEGAAAGVHGGAVHQASTGAGSVAAALVRYLGQVEGQQAVNLLALMRAEPFQLQIPFTFNAQLVTAHLAVEPDGEGGDEPGGKPKGHNVLFLLDLEGFGPTRIDVHVGPQSLRAIFYAARPQALARLRAEMPAFRDLLQTQGYGEVLLAARPLDQLPAAKQQKFAALAAGVPGTMNLVDARA